MKETMIEARERAPFDDISIYFVRLDLLVTFPASLWAEEQRYIEC